MNPLAIFRIDMALGYLAWGLVVANYIWPRVKAMDRVEAHRAIATFNSFRFFGLVFLLPGFVGRICRRASPSQSLMVTSQRESSRCLHF